MSLPLFLVCLFLSQVACLYLGKRSSKAMHGQEDYYLASRKVRFFPLMMTFAATQIGGGLVLGSADEAYHYGWSVIFYPLGACLGLILLGAGFGKKLYAMNLSTVAEIFEVKYHSKALRKIASILSILSLFMIFVAQLIASKKFLCALGFDSAIIFYLFWGIVILYTAAGGLKAVISTDILQVITFVIIFGLCLSMVISNAPMQVPDLIIQSAKATTYDVSKIFSWMFMPLLFMLIEQDMGQRCFAADSYKTVAKSTLASALFILAFSCIPIFMGILAKTLSLPISSGESILVKVIQLLTNPYMTALFACGVLLVIISTADALLNAIGSNLTLDFSYFKNKKVRISQLMTLAIAGCGLVCSAYFSSIVGMLIQSYELSVSCLLVSIAMGVFKEKPSIYGAVSSICFGALSFIIFKIIPPGPIPKEALSLVISFAGYYAGSFAENRKLALAR